VIPAFKLTLLSVAVSSSATENFNSDPESPGFLGTRRAHFHIDYITADAVSGFLAA